MKLKLSEHDIQTQILHWLALAQIFCFRNNTGAIRSTYKGRTRFMRFGAVGSPDIFALRNGTIYGIEVKSAKGRISPHQEAFAERFMNAGGIYIIARCLEDVTDMLGPLGASFK